MSLGCLTTALAALYATAIEAQQLDPDFAALLDATKHDPGPGKETSMATFIGQVIGEALILLLLLVLVLAIGRIPAARRHPLAIHIAGVALIWAVAIGVSMSAAGPPAAYLITLLAIWDYRRDLKRPPSGWYRLGSGFTVLWLLIGLLFLNASLPAAEDEMLLGAWIYVVLGMVPWLLGWLVQWIRQGFKGTGQDQVTRAGS